MEKEPKKFLLGGQRVPMLSVGLSAAPLSPVVIGFIVGQKQSTEANY